MCRPDVCVELAQRKVSAIRQKSVSLVRTAKDQIRRIQDKAERARKAAEEKAEAGKAVLDAVKEALGDEVKAVRASSILKSAACCLSAEGPVSLEMEKYMKHY